MTNFEINVKWVVYVEGINLAYGSSTVVNPSTREY